MRALVWFRNDLRLDDQPALNAACRLSDRGVLAVFVASPEQWLSHDWAPVKVDLIRRTLIELSARLAEKKIALKVIDAPAFKKAPEAIVACAKEHGCDALFSNREYELNELKRDQDVETLFKEQVGTVHSYTDQCLFEPGELRTGQGNFYTVYSPFKRAWYKKYAEDPGYGKPLGAPKAQREMVSTPDVIPEAFDGYRDIPAHAASWKAGEREARRRLDRFVEKHLGTYKDERDFPAIDGTSSLSPYLACGAISLRRCVLEALRWNDGELEKGSPGAVHWISELIWREFYKHILVGFPRVCMHRAFNIATERLRWSQNGEHLLAWQEGRTGVPIVDAAMRQLLQTGWMHNRLRMVAAMYLTKNLFIDWREGERFFMRHLVDGDLAANNGGWQWSASTGTDAAPYFRIMNPYSQSRRFDPSGAFIRRFVPELDGLSDTDIHDPSELPPLARMSIEYPKPLVDHATSRQRAIDAFKSI